MRKTLHKFFLGVVAVSTLTMLTTVNAAERAEMNQLGDLDLDITEDISDSNVLTDADLALPLPDLQSENTSEAVPQAEAAPAVMETPALEEPVSLAQVPVANEATPGNPENSNILDEPITEAPIAETPVVQEPEIPAIQEPDAPAAPADAPAAQTETQVAPAEAPAVQEPKADSNVPAEETQELPVLPPAESSILNDSTEPAQTIVPQAAVPQQSNVVTIDPVQIPYAGRQSVMANGAMTRVGAARVGATRVGVPRPVMGGGSCPDCQRETGTRRPVYYGVQRNGVHAYPRAGSCDRYYNGPMAYPYYTLRGPRDFDDPNPRPIGP